MKCYLINLDRSVDRLAHCESEFNKISVPFERVSAINSIDLGDRYIETIKLHKYFPKQTNGEFACFLSHRKCWQAIARGSHRYSAVFEDDVVLSSDSKKYLNDYRWVPDHIHLVKLETMKEIALYERFGRSVFNRKILKILSFQAGSAGYVISKDLATKLVHLTDHYMPAPVDHFLFDPRLEVMQKYSVYQLAPAICIQDNVMNAGNSVHSSLIGSLRSVDQIAVNKVKLSFFKKLKRELIRIPKRLLSFILQRRSIIMFE